MTVQTNSARKSYAGDGSTVAFAFPYRFLVNADLKIYVRDAVGTETLKSITTDYTVTGAGAGAGGTVTFLVAPIVGETVVVIRDPDLLQEIDYSEGDAFPAETHESGLDKLTMVVQRLKDRQDRSFELGETDTQGSGQYNVGGNRLSNVGAGVLENDAATVSQFAVWTTQVASDAADAASAKTGAETAQGIAETAKNDAEIAKTAAETALDEITDLYLGAKTADPATDNNGDPLQAAAWYLRTSDSVARVYNGSVWIDLSSLAVLADGSITNLKISDALNASQKENFRTRIGAKEDVPETGGMTWATPQVTTSGTAFDFTGIPSGVSRVTVFFNGMSTNGTDPILVQIGDSGGIEAVNYAGSGSFMTGAIVDSASNTAGFLINTGSAATVLQGALVLIRNANPSVAWVAEGVLGRSDAGGNFYTGGLKVLSGELDRVRITTTGGTNSFDAGSLNIAYE